jgi:hypothetical protein
MYSLRVGESLWWDEKDPTQLEWDSFPDHSDTPNVRIVLEDFDLKAPRADLVAIRPIKRGDELLINYHNHKDRYSSTILTYEENKACQTEACDTPRDRNETEIVLHQLRCGTPSRIEVL